tara:strand:- start:739 stop:912 length:174 start_codon:yes stop_codon:yes gene_type:complete
VREGEAMVLRRVFILPSDGPGSHANEKLVGKVQPDDLGNSGGMGVTTRKVKGFGKSK